ncbi:hypothetical protein MTO96_045681 [Rhipicephalus appendiculatus]
MVRSTVMTRVGRQRKWFVIGLGVSFGENSTLPARDAGMSTQIDGYWNAMPEERQRTLLFPKGCRRGGGQVCRREMGWWHERAVYMGGTDAGTSLSRAEVKGR